MAIVIRGNFEWDEAKATENERKHKVAFEEAVTAFFDDRAIMLADPQEHSDRFILVGMSNTARILYVVHAEIDDSRRKRRMRIISARVATRSEAVKYALGDAT